MTTNILTATTPMYAIPSHHGREVSAYIGLIVVVNYNGWNFLHRVEPAPLSVMI